MSSSPTSSSFPTREQASSRRIHLRGAPDLLIEIVSESTRRTDEIIKRKLYDRSGVVEYWIVDPLLETIRIWKRDGESFVRADELRLEDGDHLTTPLLPGFNAPLVDIFRV